MTNHMDDDTLVKLAEQSLTRPSDFGYYGNYPLFESWGITPIGQHRDSDALDRSNYRRILADMTKSHPDEDMGETVLEWISDFRSSHWAVGWSEQIIVRVLYDADEDITPSNITSAFREIMEIADYLSTDYPVYDDSDYSELELEEYNEAFDSAWDDLVRHWDDEDDGPSPADEEKDHVRNTIELDTSNPPDEDDLRPIMDDKRMKDTLAQYPDTPRVGTAIPGQLSLLPHPLEG